MPGSKEQPWLKFTSAKIIFQGKTYKFVILPIERKQYVAYGYS